MQGMIIGAGIGGLSTAIALNNIGIATRVYEAAAEIKPVGAGIVMAVNAMKVFHRLGIDKHIVNAGLPVKRVEVTDEKLRTITRTDLSDALSKYGHHNIAIHRGRLQEVLLKHLPADTILTGRKFSYSSEEHEQVSAFFGNTDANTADFMIGADGLNSLVRKQIFPLSHLRYSGQTCWRGVANFELPDDLKGAAIEAWGHKVRFGFLEIGQGQVYWYGVMTAKEAGRDDREGLKLRLQHIFRKFAKPVGQIIDQTDVEHIIRNDLHDLPHLSRWHKNRICLIGDAAHASTPNMGQGGCQAVEDAWFLAQSFKQGGGLEQIYQRFYDGRINRVKFIVDTSRSIGSMAHIPFGGSLRNLILRSIPTQLTEKRMSKVYEVEELS